MSDNMDEHLRRGNLLWEGSRMFLPEHREQLLAQRRSRQAFRMPHLDEERLADMSRVVSDSFTHEQPITVVYGTKYGTQRFTGIVKGVDPFAGRVKLVRTADNESQAASGEEDETLQIAFRQIVDIQE